MYRESGQIPHSIRCTTTTTDGPTTSTTAANDALDNVITFSYQRKLRASDGFTVKNVCIHFDEDSMKVTNVLATSTLHTEQSESNHRKSMATKQKLTISPVVTRRDTQDVVDHLLDPDNMSIAASSEVDIARDSSNERRNSVLSIANMNLFDGSGPRSVSPENIFNQRCSITSCAASPLSCIADALQLPAAVNDSLDDDHIARRLRSANRKQKDSCSPKYKCMVYRKRKRSWVLNQKKSGKRECVKDASAEPCSSSQNRARPVSMFKGSTTHPMLCKQVSVRVARISSADLSYIASQQPLTSTMMDDRLQLASKRRQRSPSLPFDGYDEHDLLLGTGSLSNRSAYDEVNNEVDESLSNDIQNLSFESILSSSEHRRTPKRPSFTYKTRSLSNKTFVGHLRKSITSFADAVNKEIWLHNSRYVVIKEKCERIFQNICSIELELAKERSKFIAGMHDAHLCTKNLVDAMAKHHGQWKEFKESTASRWFHMERTINAKRNTR